MTLALFEPDELPAAEFSPCRTWRYHLRRRWGSGAACGWVLLNPSTATETIDDPTIRRCIGYAKAWGFGGMTLGNIFAYRSTDPRGLRSCMDPVGPGNAEAILEICKESDGHVVCGWGTHGAFMGQGVEILRLMRDVAKVKPMALAVTSAGFPNHPLYLRADLKPFEMGEGVA